MSSAVGPGPISKGWNFAKNYFWSRGLHCSRTYHLPRYTRTGLQQVCQSLLLLAPAETC